MGLDNGSLQKPGLENVGSPTQSAESQQTSHLGRHLVPVLVGSLVLLTIVALVLLVWQRWGYNSILLPMHGLSPPFFLTIPHSLPLFFPTLSLSSPLPPHSLPFLPHYPPPPPTLSSPLSPPFSTCYNILCRRRRSRRRSQKPKLGFATSFVNPAADDHDTHAEWVFNPLDTTDKSILIVNPSN